MIMLLLEKILSTMTLCEKSPLFQTFTIEFQQQRDDNRNKKPTLSAFCKQIKFYSPGQPNWEYTMGKYHDFSATQILREINYGVCRSVKSAISTHFEALNLDIFEVLHFLKVEIFANKQDSEPLKWQKLQF